MIIAAHASMVSSDDEMRASVVLSHDGMEYRLTRSSVSHFCLEYAKNDPVLWKVIIDKHFVALKYDIVPEVALLFLTDNGIDEQPIHNSKCGFLKVFMPQMRNVSCLESYDLFPPFLFKEVACFHRFHCILEIRCF